MNITETNSFFLIRVFPLLFPVNEHGDMRFRSKSQDLRRTTCANCLEATRMSIILWIGIIAFVMSLQTKSTYASVLYTAPFAFLFVITLVSNHRLTRRAIAAAIGAAIPVAVFHSLFLYDIWVRLPGEGGGANIGLGILLVYLMPCIVVFAMVMGWGLQTRGQQDPREGAVDPPK